MKKEFIKKTSIFVALVFILLSFTVVAGCISTETKDTIDFRDSNNGQSKIDNIEFWVDSQTGVIYIYTYQYSRRTGSISTTFELLVNSNGTPRIYDPKTDLMPVYKF